MNFYDILGVTQEATDAEIKLAYRRKARQCHPDLNKDADATERFQEIQEAYDVLRDHTSRNEYDEKGPQFNRQNRECISTAETFIVGNALKWVEEVSNDRPTADMLEDLTKVFDGLITQAATSVLEGDALADRLTRSLHKLTHKGKRDFLTIALEARIEHIRQQQDCVRNSLVALQLAKTLLKDYDFACIKQLYGRPGSMDFGMQQGIVITRYTP